MRDFSSGVHLYYYNTKYASKQEKKKRLLRGPFLQKLHPINSSYTEALSVVQ